MARISFICFKFLMADNVAKFVSMSSADCKTVVSLASLCFLNGCSGKMEAIQPDIVDFALPEHSGRCTLAIQPMHEFLAEYSYHLIVRPTQGPDSEFDLMMQTGGQPNMKFFFYPRGREGGPYLQIFHPNGSIPCADLINVRAGMRFEEGDESKKYEKQLKVLSSVKPIFMGSINRELKFVESEH